MKLTRSILTPAVGAAALLLCSSCLAEDTMAVGILTKIPDISSMGLLGDDLMALIGELPVGEQVLASTFLAKRPSLTGGGDPVGIYGATVRLAWYMKDEGQILVDLKEDSSSLVGTYMAMNSMGSDGSSDASTDSFQNADLVYIAGLPYTVYIDIAGDPYYLGIDAPEAIPSENITLDPPLDASSDITFPTNPSTGEPIHEPLVLGVGSHPQGADLTITWEPTDPSKPPQTFMSLFRIDYTGSADPIEIINPASWNVGGNPMVASNLPSEAADFLKLVTDEPATDITITGDTFTPGLYILLLTVMELNTDNEMAIGSAGIGGASTPFVFMVMP